MPAHGRPLTVETFKPQPGAEQQLVCPNPACNLPDKLVLMERVTVCTEAVFFDVGVTFPEIDKDEDTEQVTPDGGRQISGIRCTACRWSIQGPPAYVLASLTKLSP